MTRLNRCVPAMACVIVIAIAGAATGQSFVNWETPHVSPLALSADGTKLLAVNTADNRLEVFTLTKSGPVKLGAVPVGLDPASVRARPGTNEAWIVNHVSDSISVVDLATMRVRATILTGDEPCDVAFAGAPLRAFVSVSQLNQVRVIDPVTLAQVGAPITIEGEDPRALATDGTNVYAAIFESGNRTTVLPFQTVNTPALNPYPGDPNPPPNAGSAFDPPMTPGNPTPPGVSLIVKRDAGANIWRDDNTGVWSSAVAWNVHDHDVAIINANSLALSYVTGLMNLNMHIAVKPGGQVTVVGTEATNHIRFEPNVSGTFVRVVGASFPIGGGAGSASDLNPHLNYASATVPQNQRDLSIGDPRGIAWESSGSRTFITGMGSNNVIVTGPSFNRIANINVGNGPTGVAIDEPRGLVYVLNKFDGSISVIDSQSLIESQRVSFFDPTPGMIKTGRPFLYDTHRTSGLGQASCASCHIDGRMDQIAWDLGDPSGAVKTFNQTCQAPLGGACENWHPMKGPMATQTLVGIFGTGPLHWRGDRENLAAFNGAFIGLLGDDTTLSPQEMTDFTDFVATLRFPPQPNRSIDDSLKTTFPNGGNPQTGFNRFMNQPIDGGVLTCVFCHAMPTGTNGTITPAAALQDTQSVKIPQLRNMHEKTGFLLTGPGAQNNNKGFGFIKDGSIDTLFSFLQFSGFNYNVNPQPPATADQQRRDIEAFLLSFPTGTHAGVGSQTTVVNGGAIPDGQQTLLNTMLNLAASNAVGLVVKGVQNNEQRGYAFNGGGSFLSDRAAQTISSAALLTAASVGSELTWTLVPKGSETRIGIDRDSDGFFDRDELDVCASPANPLETPANVCVADVNDSGDVNIDDLLAVVNSWGFTGPPGALIADMAPNCGDGAVNIDDLLAIINGWGACL